MGKIATVFIVRFMFILVTAFCTIPSSAQQAPDTVSIGSYVVSIHDINFHDKEYVVRFWVWMRYKNPKLNFAERVEVINAKEIEKQDVMADTTENGVYVLMKLKCVMKQSWNVEDFPFDSQSLEVHIENSEFDTRSLVFVPDTTGAHYDPKLTINGWNINNFKASTTLNHYNTDFGDASLEKDESDYASYVISLDLHRNAWGLYFKLFIGMYIAFAIAFISLYVDHTDADPRFGLPVGGLFGSIGNKYIIDSILPESSSFTLVDMLHAATFIGIFVILSTSVYTLRLFDSGRKNLAREIDRIGRNVIISLYVTFNLVMILMAILG